MSERKLSLGRGAASIFSGVSQSLKEKNPHSDADEQSAEMMQSDSKDRKLNEETNFEANQGTFAELSREGYNEPEGTTKSASCSDVGSQQMIAGSQTDMDKIKVIVKTALSQAIKEGLENPKITVYSPLIASFMRYKEITIPRFKLSPQTEGRLEQVLRRENLALWNAIKKNVHWNKRKDFQKPQEEGYPIVSPLVEQAIYEGMKYPKVTVYSPIIASFMRYMELTTPRFKLSPAIESRMEPILKNEDPELWNAIKEKISWKKRKKGSS